MDCDQRLYLSVALTPVPVRVPTLRPLAPSSTSVVGLAKNFFTPFLRNNIKNMNDVDAEDREWWRLGVRARRGV